MEDLNGETETREASDLNDTVNVLYQTALVKSGFNIPDPNAWVVWPSAGAASLTLSARSYFTQIEQILRRSLGVSQTAEAVVDVKPAPAVETGPVRPAPPSMEDTFGGMGGDFPNWAGESSRASLHSLADFALIPQTSRTR